MKKFLALFLCIVLGISFLSSCNSGGESKETGDKGTQGDILGSKEGGNSGSGTEGEKKSLTGKVIIWSFTTELDVFANDFKRQNPDVEVEYTMIPMTSGEYQTKLQQALATGAEVPDVIVLEISFLRQFVESPYLKDLSHLKSKADALEIYPFTVEAGTDAEGVIKAFSYQATPGALFYRRSLAKEYFGTDEPKEIQALMSDFTKFEAAAEVIKEKSGGDTYIVGSSGDFSNTFFSNRKEPWIVDDKFVVDPKIMELWDVSKTFREKGYEAQTTQWQEGWFAGMNDTLKDSAGTPKKIFSYLLPTWGLPYVLMRNAKTETTDTSGDWAMIPGPMPYQWGGTWLGVAKEAQNPDNAEAFIEFCTLNETTLTNWATGVYTNEYLKETNPNIGELFQGAGDFVSSQVVVNKIKDQFDNADTSAFLNGQNAYIEFAQVAPDINLKLIQGSDDAIQRAMADIMETYIVGKVTKEEGVKSFKEAVRTILPEEIQID